MIVTLSAIKKFTINLSPINRESKLLSQELTGKSNGPLKLEYQLE